MVHYVATDDGAHHDDQAYDDKHAADPGVRVERSDVSGDTGAARWLSIHDDLLRGLAHAFSNQVATVAAVAALFDASRVPDERVLAGLRSDADRLDGLLEHLRQLPRRGAAELEPLMPGDRPKASLLWRRWCTNVERG